MIIILDMKKKISNNRACYFLSIEVENVACFGEKQVLNLANEKGQPHRWTVIVGDNGVGKTTLLRCLAGISPYNIDEPNSMIISFPGLMWKYIREKDGKRLNPSIKAYISLDWRFTGKPKEQISKNIGHSSFSWGETFSTNGSPTFLPGGGQGAINSYSKDLHFICNGYGASRRMSRNKLSTEKKAFPTQSLFDDDAPLTHAEEWLLQADYISSKDPKYLGYKKQVEDIILRLLPDVTKIDYRVSKQASNVLFETPTGWVGINELSLGYRTMLAWMIDFTASLFDRYPNSKNPLAEPAILLIDEIDLHLHPKWQRTIIEYLTEIFPNTQFIITAHSPIMVQAAADTNMVLLKREGNRNNIIIDNKPASVEHWRVDQILTSDLFGLESVRSPQTQKLRNERTRLLTKKKPGKKDIMRIAELDEKLSSMPIGDTKEEIAADFLFKEIARKIAESEKNKK